MAQTAQTLERPAASFSLSPILTDNKVVILTGWHGAGKTEFLKLFLNSLRSQWESVGVIVNEKSLESAILDMQTLPSGARTKAIAGCACCESIDQIEASVQEFANAGARLTIIEQSPLSWTARTMQRLEGLGFKTSVIAVVNPQQIADAESFIYPQISTANGVVLTDVGADNPDGRLRIKETTALISELTDDMPERPLVLASMGVDDFEPLVKLWPCIQADTGSHRAGGSSRQEMASGWEAQRLEILKSFSEVFVHVYQGLTNDEIVKALSTLETNPSEGIDGVVSAERVKVLRAKGVIANQNVSVRADAHGLHIKRSARHPDAPRFDGRDFLLVRALDPRIHRCTASFYENLGTQECSPTTIATIKALYPTQKQIRESLKKGQLEVVLSADTLFRDLIDSLPYLEKIPDLGRQQQVGQAVISLLEAFLELRTVLHQELAAYSPFQAQVAFDAAFATCKILSHPHLQPILTEPDSPLFQTAQELEKAGPVTQLLRGLAETKILAINGRQRVSAEDVEWLRIIFEKAHRENRVERSLAQAACRNIEVLAPKDETCSWKMYLIDIKKALLG